jgi:hypothetical protein
VQKRVYGSAGRGLNPVAAMPVFTRHVGAEFLTAWTEGPIAAAWPRLFGSPSETG